MSDRQLPNKPRPRLPTNPGIAPRPTIDVLAEGERTPGPHDAVNALTDSERDLMQSVLLTARNALAASKAASEREERERANLEGRLLARFDDQDARIDEVKKVVSEMRILLGEVRGSAGDLRGLRGDVATLNAHVMQNLAADAARERTVGELKLQVEMQAARAGHDAGKTSGIKWGALTSGAVTVLTTLAYLIAYLASLSSGAPPPPKPPALPPALPPASSTK